MWWVNFCVYTFDLEFFKKIFIKILMEKSNSLKQKRVQSIRCPKIVKYYIEEIMYFKSEHREK